MLLNTIYPSFMGECNTHGIGVPCTFIRLSGCNLRCYFKTKGVLCDTPEALSASSGRSISVAEIVHEVKRLGRKVVCLTGGEPLLQDVGELLMELSKEGFYVVVETNGSVSITPYRSFRNVSFVVDVKSTSSGESERMLESNYELLDRNDFVKFVIDTEEDYEEFEKWMVSHDWITCNVAVGLFWGAKVRYSWLIDKISPLRNVSLNMQTHKMTCMYDVYREYASFQDMFIPKNL